MSEKIEQAEPRTKPTREQVVTWWETFDGPAYPTGEQVADAVLALWPGRTEAEVAAEAWHEGHRVGWEHCQDGNYGNDYWDDPTPSPYARAAATRAGGTP